MSAAESSALLLDTLKKFFLIFFNIFFKIKGRKGVAGDGSSIKCLLHKDENLSEFEPQHPCKTLW